MSFRTPTGQGITYRHFRFSWFSGWRAFTPLDWQARYIAKRLIRRVWNRGCVFSANTPSGFYIEIGPHEWRIIDAKGHVQRIR